jgi:divalent metal cation (Fe/Co/Zn/Cd) transporter
MAIALGAESARRLVLVRASRRLTLATLCYNALEGVVAIVSGLAAGSVALVGFGVDSAIELSASLVALWRLAADPDPRQRERVERASMLLIGLSFLVLSAYIAADAAAALVRRDAPAASPLGVTLAATSLVVMPLLARAKRRNAQALGSLALAAEATQTALCTYLSAILLGGLALNAAAGWWWADPVAALAMVPIIAREGVAGLRAEGARAPDCC